MLDGLASLVEKSLVQMEGRSAEEVRYRLLEYALEQLRGNRSGLALTQLYGGNQLRCPSYPDRK